MAVKKSPIWTIWNIVVALLFVTLGVITCAFSGNVDFQNTIIRIVGIILLVIAGLQITFQILRIILAGDETTVSADLSIAGVTASELALGIVMIIISNEGGAEIIFKYLGYFLGIALISAGGIVFIYEIVFLIKKHHKLGLAILSMIGALIPVALGIIVLVFINDQQRFLTFFFVCVGILFILLGLGYLALIILGIRKRRALAKLVVEEAKEEPVAEAVVEEPKAEEPAPKVEEKPEEKPEDKPEEK